MRQLGLKFSENRDESVRSTRGGKRAGAGRKRLPAGRLVGAAHRIAQEQSTERVTLFM